jgi:hypothetical protein
LIAVTEFAAQHRPMHTSVSSSRTRLYPFISLLLWRHVEFEEFGGETFIEDFSRTP